MDDVAPNSSPVRIGGIVFVILLHVGIIYALATGLGSNVVEILRTPLQARIIQPAQPPRVQPPPPPPPQAVRIPPPFIPLPLIEVARPPPPVIAEVSHVKPAAPVPVRPPPPSKPAAIVKGAALDPDQSCAPPEYPQTAQDMGEQGVSVLQFLIGSGGAVEQSRVALSSGHAQLDQAALQALGACRFRPAMGADGQPREAWTSIRYVWSLN